jgi:hypothetical protein
MMGLVVGMIGYICRRNMGRVVLLHSQDSRDTERWRQPQ